MIAKSMTGEELARELITVLSINYSVSPTSLLAAMRDRASVNNVALRTLKVVYSLVVDVGCFSHTINLAGEHFLPSQSLGAHGCRCLLTVPKLDSYGRSKS